ALASFFSGAFASGLGAGLSSAAEAGTVRPSMAPAVNDRNARRPNLSKRVMGRLLKSRVKMPNAFTLYDGGARGKVCNEMQRRAGSVSDPANASWAYHREKTRSGDCQRSCGRKARYALHRKAALQAAGKRPSCSPWA